MNNNEENYFVSSSFGGWIVDGFPKTHDDWAAMIENDMLPDSVICLDDHQAPENYLFSRFTKCHSLSGDNDGSVINGNDLKNEVNSPY